MRKSILAVTAWSTIVFLALGSVAFAASTIGTNMSTTGTFTLTSGTNSATAAMFQNASSYSVLTINTTSLVASASKLGVNPGGTVDTVFEVGGTASISGAITLNTGSFLPRADSITAFKFQNAAGTNVLTIDTTGKTASVSSKFGINAGGTLDTALEVGGTASISGIVTLADGRFQPRANATNAFRFQVAAGVYSALTIDTTGLTASVSTKLGVSSGVTTDTTLEVGGTASISTLIVGGVASGSSVYQAQFNSQTATSSALFSSTNTSPKGTCLQLRDTSGANVYCRVNADAATVFTCNTKKCR